MFAQSMFAPPLLDLGECEDPRFAGVLTPAPEIGVQRSGATVEFLENAEAYYERHQGFDYWKLLLTTALDKTDIRSVGTIVEYGCGFGNATLPALDLFPDANIVASDISPNLLAILHRLLVARGIRDRCIPVAFDAHKPYLREEVADLVMGSAILHHLAEPGKLIRATARVLKPGGWAIFFEPMEAGYAILRLAIREMSREAATREFTSPALTWLVEMSAVWALQIRREELPGWRDLDDKWMFPRSVLQGFADDAGMELVLTRLHANTDQSDSMERNLRYMLKGWKGIDPNDATVMPPWTWDIVSRYDWEFFSRALKEDLLFEAAVMFRKR